MFAKFRLLKKDADGKFKLLRKNDVSDLSVGGFLFEIGEKSVPFDFKATAVHFEDDVLYYESGYGPFVNAHYLDECFEDEYAELGIATSDLIAPKLAMDSLARIYGSSNPALPTVELPRTQERILTRIVKAGEEIEEHQKEVKKLEKEIEAHSVRIAELMKDHEHGVLETTTDRFLIDFVSKTSNRADTTALKKKYPAIYSELIKTSESRKLKVSRVPL